MPSQGLGVTVSAFHPGAIASDVFRDSAVGRVLMNTRAAKALLSTPEQGAEPLIRLATTGDAHAVNGRYFHGHKLEEPRNKRAVDPDLARRLWDRSAKLTGVPANF